MSQEVSDRERVEKREEGDDGGDSREGRSILKARGLDAIDFPTPGVVHAWGWGQTGVNLIL